MKSILYPIDGITPPIRALTLHSHSFFPVSLSNTNITPELECNNCYDSANRSYLLILENIHGRTILLLSLCVDCSCHSAFQFTNLTNPNLYDLVRSKRNVWL